MPALANLPPGEQRYLATKYLLSLADGEKGIRKAIILLRENIAARNQAAMRKVGGGWQRCQRRRGADAGGGKQPSPGSKRRPAKGGDPDC